MSTKDLSRTIMERGRNRSYRKRKSVERWLGSHVGQHWDAVRSKMHERFNTKTFAGRTLVYDFLLIFVREKEHATNDRWRERFRVDAQGRLQRIPIEERALWRKSCKLPKGKKHYPSDRVLHWTRSRKVGLRGRTWFWFESTSPPSERPSREEQVRYRQTHALAPEEVAFWNTLTEEIQDRFRFDRAD